MIIIIIIIIIMMIMYVILMIFEKTIMRTITGSSFLTSKATYIALFNGDDYSEYFWGQTYEAKMTQ
jgi:uncharacterized MnhB-related membrane protein